MLERGPRLNAGVIASGVVSLSITGSLIFVSVVSYAADLVVDLTLLTSDGNF